MQTAIPCIPETAPFSLEQRAWLNGFLAGLFSRTAAPAAIAGATTAPVAPTLNPLTILFGSQTGTAERLAKRAAKEAGKRGFAPTVLDMAQTDIAKLAGEKTILVITSTYGDGEPPDNAKSLLDALMKDGSASLGGLRFSVCSLGDKNYAKFCKCGQDFDAALEKHGAQRTAPRVDCDVEYEADFARWLGTALGSFSASAPLETTSPEPASSAATDPATEEPVSRYHKDAPFPAVLLASRTLNGDGSAKEVRHVELSLEGSDLSYEAGDALGVMPQNCPELVGEILAALGCDGEEAVPAPDGSTISLHRALASCYDIGRPSPELLASVSDRSNGGVATAVSALQLIDVLRAYPDVKFLPAALIPLLKKLQPRLYSISSSPKAHPGQVHLTVGAVRYEAAGRLRKGVCSTFLADRVTPGESRVGVFVHRNKAFRPPTLSDTPMIMVGPGTGIAPFRAFLQERQATGAKGRNWLLFGDQRAATDFLYRDELIAMQQSGLLTRLDTAFSRDQADKVYVQHRMLENAKELYSWLEAGAHFYVCGDASRMARDVDAALHEVVQKAGGKTAEQAADYVDALRAAKRYQRDVY